MFGILKSGLKLGIGCFIAGILFILLIIGAWYYYYGRKPESRPRNTNRRAAILQTSGAATFAVALKAAGVSAPSLF
jgi:uncharacterized iron-regulated membrane protein